VLAIEALCYLNEDGVVGARECARVLAGDGQFLVSVRGYEAGLLIRALHSGGLGGMLRVGIGRDMWDGVGEGEIRSRCYTRGEIAALLASIGLRVTKTMGISVFSVVLSFLNGIGRLGAESDIDLDDLHTLLKHLGEHGDYMRTHVLIAERAEPHGYD